MRLSFREAAREANVSIGAIQNAVKRGELADLDQDEVRIWRYQRATKGELKQAMDLIADVWNEAMAWSLAEMTSVNPQDANELIELNNTTVGKFVNDMSKIDHKHLFGWSEYVLAGHEANRLAFEQDVPDKEGQGDIVRRFRFIQYLTAKQRLRFLLESWNKNAKEINEKFPDVEFIISGSKFKDFKTFEKSFETLQ